MSLIPAIYEQGVFRPLQPVELPEGARVEVLANDQPAQSAEQPEGTAQLLVGEELAALLMRIDDLPLESLPDPDLSATYREILYPRTGQAP